MGAGEAEEGVGVGRVAVDGGAERLGRQGEVALRPARPARWPGAGSADAAYLLLGGVEEEFEELVGVVAAEVEQRLSQRDA